MTSKTDGISTTTYTWDEDNHLTQVQRTGTSPFTVSYAYDNVGRMLTRTDASGTSKFVWDGMHCVREIASDTTVTDYYMPQGQLMSFKRASTTYNGRAEFINAKREAALRNRILAPYRNFLQQRGLVR